MVSFLYRRHGKLLLAFVALSFPFFYSQASSIKSNNDIETWLPRNTGVRQEYERFKRDFGAEEAIVVALPRGDASPRLIEAMAARVERIDGIRAAWTPDRVRSQMNAMGVDDAVANQRMEGLLYSSDGPYVGLIALLSPEGVQRRAGIVDDLRAELKYCRLDGPGTALTGAPVIVTELDRLGSQQVSRKFFAITCAVSLGLLYLAFGHWGLALSTLGVTLWGIYVTQTVLAWCGGEMNFIMGSLSVMTMVFTLSIAVHFIAYYSEARNEGAEDPLASALRKSWAPCWLSTLTTLLGLISLNVSSILPVAQFGYAAALGAILALVVGLGVMPALTVVWPNCQCRPFGLRFDFSWWADVIDRRRWQILADGGVLLVIMGVGLSLLKSDVDPVEFLPRNSTIYRDLSQIETHLTNVDSLEAVVDFTGRDLPFFDQVREVRSLQDRIGSHPGVRHVMSAVSFLPTELPESSVEVARILSQANAAGEDSGWVTPDRQKWRISARVRRSQAFSPVAILTDLDQKLAGEPIKFTGLTPLLKNAQYEIFDGFWQSFAAACLTISLVMVLSLRSVVAGVIAMVPNIVPIWLVFGAVGFYGLPVDIGMMMTGSIALGVSVDCTFHFLVHYRQAYESGMTSAESAKEALRHSGEPMLESTLICSLGMLALCLSDFAPTARFGALMATQMLASLLGELVFLPALLCCRPERRRATIAKPETSAVPIPGWDPAATLAAPHIEAVRPGRRHSRDDLLENVA